VSSAWPVLSALFFVFIVTFIIFPGAFFDEHFAMTDSFTNVTLIIILVFNVTDTIGRKAGALISLPDGVVYILSLLRLALVVLTIIIVKDDGDSNFIEKDAVKMMNLALFAFTNGFVSTQCAIRAGKFVPEDLRDKIGIYVSLSIGLGILCGSVIAIPVGSSLPVNWQN
jgi:hypothetical protein